MFDDFKIEQPKAYHLLTNSVLNDKISHAYIIESNGYSKSLDFVLAFAKHLLCPNKYTNNKNCKNCNQCQKIKDSDFLELKVIEPEGQWIKKEQLSELQNEFSKKSIVGNKKIYIINGADKLNISSSNSILKFLEEPEEGIIAILICDNINQLLKTIVSRCQIISLKDDSNKVNDTFTKIALYINNDTNSIQEYIENETNKENINNVVKFIKFYEKNHLDTIVYIKKVWNDYFKDRKQIDQAFEIMLLFYKDVLNLKLNRNINIFNDYMEDLNIISNINQVDKLINKINVILKLKENIKFNVNLNMLMDKLIIELEGCE